MADSNFKWYALRAISGKENKVKEYIDGALVTSSLFREYVSQVLIPTEKVMVLRNGKRTVKERNMLPGYVLVECNLCDESYPMIRNIPNVLGFVSDGKTKSKAQVVSQAEINRLVGKASEDEQNLQLDDIFIAGEKVNGFNGIILDVMQDKHKLKVEVTIFDRKTPLELGYNQVEKE